MKTGPNVVVFEPPGLNGRGLCEPFCTRGFRLERRDLVEAAQQETFERPDIAVVVAAGGDPAVLERAATLLERLVAENVATLVCGASDNLRWAGGPLVDWLDTNTTLDEIVGRLSTLARYVPLMRRFERELDHLHRLGDQLNRYFSEIDQEMRLAGRLQRDFLPRSLPDLPDCEFSVLYRPASWVSGDMYDVFRIDEQHVGVFVADAMGHGVAAGLLTMFLRQALVPKKVVGTSYSIVSPPEALTDLHACLVRQKLPNCQFVTAAYGILNTETHELRLSRAGHPYPFHVRANGEIDQVQVCGGLLGLADLEADFEEVCLKLSPGDKVVLFTDGLEEDFFENGAQGGKISPALAEWVRLPARTFADVVRDHLDTKEGSLHPADDITLLTLELTPVKP